MDKTASINGGSLVAALFRAMDLGLKYVASMASNTGFLCHNPVLKGLGPGIWFNRTVHEPGR